MIKTSRAVIVSLLLTITYASQAKSSDINVYDNSNQLLGIFLSGRLYSSDPFITVYLPSVDKYTTIRRSYSSNSTPAPLGAVGYIQDHEVFFASQGCTGDEYVSLGTPLGLIYRGSDGIFREVIGPAVFIEKGSTFFMPGECEGFINGTQTAVLHTKSVDYQLPFQLPVVYPLRFKREETSLENKGSIGLADAIKALQVVSGQ